MSRTRYEWTLADFAIWAAGAVTVPIYETSSAEQVQWILSDSGAVAVIVETPAHAGIVGEVRSDLPDLRDVWQIESGALDDLVTAGADTDEKAVLDRLADVAPDDLATIIYTSGTTGRPKGCELTHRNFVDLTNNTNAIFGDLLHTDASTLLFLPLAHVFARFIEVLCVGTRVTMGHTADIKALVEDLGEFQPTFILSVPRVFEKVYNSAEQKAESEGRGKIFRAAADTAIQWSEAADKGGAGPLLRLKHAVFDRLVYVKLRAALGGRVEYSVSGGAPLGARLGHFYRGIGLIVLEGYGLTETTAPSTVNRPAALRDRHGRAAAARRDDPDRRRRRDPGQGLPRLRGVLAQPGGHRRGQAGRLVPHRRRRRARRPGLPADHRAQEGDPGHRRRQERRAGRPRGPAPGPPAGLADHRGRRPEAVHRGARHPGRRDAADLAGQQRQAGHGRRAAAADDPDVRAAIQAGVDDANKAVSKAEAIRKFDILVDDFTEANGYLTPSLKLKRNLVMKDYAGQVEALYS